LHFQGGGEIEGGLSLLAGEALDASARFRRIARSSSRFPTTAETGMRVLYVVAETSVAK
jgi:hypothetical protein